ncbi:MAG TPA: bifunctional phosphoribosylaminoimidazolecarboxamide formyltransferase/IMP cyclohydrolase [Candidatus Cloacimonadota bacterium]|nr:bifunctional phosphoribosylaminoimidazolecarboxamide formyltransferase/IMP cyclohydrolase [Candidatus Cloacimonadota bacterium]
MKKYALITVSDKAGVEALAMGLEKLGFTILSTSKTARHLRQFCSEVVEIADLTGFQEILDGRVKTLHPIIHAGILADRDEPSHIKTLQDLSIDHIDVVAVNLYPFAQTRATEGVSHSQIIENIDVGGPTLIRAAAKNYRHVIVLTDPRDYAPTLDLLGSEAGTQEGWRLYLAHKAFELVTHYDSDIADYLSELHVDLLPVTEMPGFMDLNCSLQSKLRYGENPHQKAGFYVTRRDGWKSLHGKELSLNNILDIDSSLRSVRLFEEPTVVITKHCNPCGIGSGFNLADAYRKAFATDTVSPFGGIVAVNRPLDMETAVSINRIFTEIIIAPAYEPGVLDVLIKKKDRRLIQYDPEFLLKPRNPYEMKSMWWGYLVQEWDMVDIDISKWRVVTQKQPTQEQFDAMVWGWKVASLLRSNAIALTTHDQVMGLGIGQTSRIDSTAIAIWKAKKFNHDLSKAVCASDGFFPYRDSIDELYQHGIKAVVQPGGSKSDAEVIQACNELDVAMVFTGFRHFRH